MRPHLSNASIEVGSDVAASPFIGVGGSSQPHLRFRQELHVIGENVLLLEVVVYCQADLKTNEINFVFCKTVMKMKNLRLKSCVEYGSGRKGYMC